MERGPTVVAGEERKYQNTNVFIYTSDNPWVALRSSEIEEVNFKFNAFIGFDWFCKTKFIKTKN